jgi:hypothetical protein
VDSVTTTDYETVIDSETVTDVENGTIVINEIVAKPSSGNDWIELYVIQGSVDLSRYSIIDDDADHTAQALPDIILSEGEYIVIEAIDEEDISDDIEYYVTFKLGSDDAVTLYEDDQEIDTLDWDDGEADEGYSYGLLPDGTGNAQTLTPTQGTSNEEASDSTEENNESLDTVINYNPALRINEVVAKDADGGYDWIELYVTGSESIDLSNYTLSDESSDQLSLPSITLSPGEYYRVYATKDDVEDIDSVAFALGGSDEVNLYAGDDLIDSLSWKKGQALINYSFGRYPDGSDAIRTLTPTVADANITTQPSPLVINEVVANSSSGNDWFELYNNGSATIELSDYLIVDNDSDSEASLPEVSLSPGEYYVIYATGTDNEGDYVAFTLEDSDELSLIKDDETVDYIDWDASDGAKWL